jgi:hypothetical protein
MKLNLSIYSALPAIATSAVLGLLATSANALTLNQSSGTWSNVVDGTSVNFQTVGNESQVLWGEGAGYGQSALGFTGVGTSTFDIGETFLLGSLRHYNKPIYAGSAASAADLTIALNFGDPALSKSFGFTLNIDETPNIGPCAYPGTTICPDKISFPTTIFPGNSFEIAGADYTLQILGFSQDANGTPVNELISEELGGNQADFYLFGKVIPVTPPTQVPEPFSFGGLALIGLYLLRKPR